MIKMTSSKMENNIIIALGSNFDQLRNVENAKRRLESLFSGIQFSRSLWTEPIGIESPRFVNALAAARSSSPKEEIERQLKRLEKESGRCREEKNLGIVRIDLDLILYGTEKLHPEDWSREYILTLLKDFGAFFE